jgi:hypothetical protein
MSNWTAASVVPLASFLNARFTIAPVKATHDLSSPGGATLNPSI